MRDSWLTLAIAGSRASSMRGRTPLCPQRRPPRLRQPYFGVFRRGGQHLGRYTTPNRNHTTSNRDLTTTKRVELHHERHAVELTPRRVRRQTGGIAPLEARHAGDTPWRGFSCCKTPTITRTESGCGTHERKGQAAAPSHPITRQLHTGPRCSIHRNEAHATTYNTDFPKPALRKVTSPATQSVR